MEMLGKIVKALASAPEGILRTIGDLTEKLLGRDGENWLGQLKRFLRKEPTWKEDNHLLFPINRDLILRELDGSRTIYNADGLSIKVDPSFKNCEEDEKISTPETKVEIWGMRKNAPPVFMFSSISYDLDALSLTQNQIIEFVEKHRPQLREQGHGTFFLLKSANYYFVVSACVFVDGLIFLYKYELGDTSIRSAVYNHRVIVRQLSK